MKNNSKWIEVLNAKPKTLILLDDNIGQKLQDSGFRNDFLDMTSKAHTKKINWAL